MVTKDEALAAKKRFVAEHWKYPPINAVGITWDENKNYVSTVLTISPMDYRKRLTA